MGTLSLSQSPLPSFCLVYFFLQKRCPSHHVNPPQHIKPHQDCTYHPLRPGKAALPGGNIAESHLLWSFKKFLIYLGCLGLYIPSINPPTLSRRERRLVGRGAPNLSTFPS